MTDALTWHAQGNLFITPHKVSRHIGAAHLAEEALVVLGHQLQLALRLPAKVQVLTLYKSVGASRIGQSRTIQ